MKKLEKSFRTAINELNYTYGLHFKVEDYSIGGINGVALRHVDPNENIFALEGPRPKEELYEEAHMEFMKYIKLRESIKIDKPGMKIRTICIKDLIMEIYAKSVRDQQRLATGDPAGSPESESIQ